MSGVFQDVKLGFKRVIILNRRALSNILSGAPSMYVSYIPAAQKSTGVYNVGS